jgi:hypothetical protein
VGWWVVVSVGWLVRWPKGIGTGHIRDFFPPEPIVVFEMEWKRVTWTISTMNVQYSI